MPPQANSGVPSSAPPGNTLRRKPLSILNWEKVPVFKVRDSIIVRNPVSASPLQWLLSVPAPFHVLGCRCFALPVRTRNESTCCARALPGP
eukprot:4758381-Pleurochrysis_carterae.AAC.1